MSLTSLTTKLLLLLAVCNLTGCYKHQTHIRPVQLNIQPHCDDYEHTESILGEQVCVPDWKDEPYMHDPACEWVYGGDEICFDKT